MRASHDAIAIVIPAVSTPVIHRCAVNNRHQWEHVPTYIASVDSPDGNERQERTCQHTGCGLVKITVIPPMQPPWPWRVWRWPDGDEFVSDGTPECRGASAQKVELKEAAE